MHREQHAAALDVPHDVIGALGGNAGILQRRRQSAGHVAGGFAEPGRERARGDNRPDARKDDGDGREHLAAQLTEPGGRA